MKNQGSENSEKYINLEFSSFDQIKTNIENYVHIFSHLTRFDWVFIKMKYIPTSNEKMGKLKMRRIRQNRREEQNLPGKLSQ